MELAQIDFKLVAQDNLTPDEIWKSPTCSTLRGEINRLGAEVAPKHRGGFSFDDMELADLEQAASDLLASQPSLRFVFQAQMPDEIAIEVEKALATAIKQGVVEKITDVRRGLQNICLA